MTGILEQMLGPQGPVVYLVVGLLVFAEDAVFVGFVLPGETAAILGGVAASRSHVSLILMCILVVVTAIAGDSVGYKMVCTTAPDLFGKASRRRAKRIDAARATLARRGRPAVFGGRFVAFLRTAMPFLAGTSGMRYPRFLAYNAAGGLVWGVGSVLLGYLAGDSYTAVGRTFGRATALVAAAVAVIDLVLWNIRRRRRAAGSGNAHGQEIPKADRRPATAGRSTPT